MVDEVLTDAEKTYLNLMMPEDLDEDIVFPLDDKLLKIIVKLNAEEILFSTIYFLPSGKAGGRDGQPGGETMKRSMFVSAINKSCLGGE